MRCVAFTFIRELAKKSSSVFQFKLAPKAPIKLLSSSILSGPRLGKTSASTGRVISPSVRLKRMYFMISSCDGSALRRFIAFGRTADISVFFKVGCWRKKSTATHGMSLAESIVRSTTGWSFTLPGIRTCLKVVFNAVGCFWYSLNEDALNETKRCSGCWAPQNFVLFDK